MGPRLTALVLAPLAACGDPYAELVERGCADVLLDSLGAAYPTDSDAGCRPSHGPASAELPCPDDLEPNTVFIWDRLVGACPACDAGFSPTDCRPLVCEEDRDCPWMVFDDGSADGDAVVFECIAGLCQNADQAHHDPDEIDEFDADMACLADVARRGGEYLGEPYCPGRLDVPHAACPLPLPDACAQP